jgi:hypothetical protein
LAASKQALRTADTKYFQENKSKWTMMQKILGKRLSAVDGWDGYGKHQDNFRKIRLIHRC